MLITLAIIGVVAAMTIPVLLSNINDKALETQHKKAKSLLANGFKMFFAQDGVTEIKNTELAACGNNKDCVAQNLKKVLKVVDADNNISSIEYEFETESKKFWDNNSQILYSFRTPDGMIFGVTNDDITAGTINIIADVNGEKGPNKGGTDLCKFSVSNDSTLAENCEVMKNYRVSNCSVDNLEACNEAECDALTVTCSPVRYCMRDNRCQICGAQEPCPPSLEDEDWPFTPEPEVSIPEN